MSTRRLLATLSVAVVALLAAVVLAPSPSNPDVYAGFRQASIQEIPGTFGYMLSAPGGIVPSVDPTATYRTLVGASSDRDVTLTLANVGNESEGTSWGPAWVYLTRDLCYFTAKGDFVSPSRAGDDDACTAKNLLVQVVDARSGAFLAAFDAYDANSNWRPDRGTTTVQTPGLTRFH